MDTRQFESEFTKLLGSFPHFRPEDKRTMAATWFEHLRRFDMAVMRRARHAIVESGKAFLPSLGEMVAECNAQAETLRKQRDAERISSNIQPEPHPGCVVKKSAKVKKVSGAHRLLQNIAPYESCHVFCPGRPRPICPVCGLAQEPFDNPLIVGLIELFPPETIGWNPAHKGLLVCPSCKRQTQTIAEPDLVTVP